MAESWGENDKVVSSGDWGADDPEVKPKGGFGAAAKQAVGAVVKGAGQAIEDFTPDAVGKDNAIKRYGQGVIDANPTAIQGDKDILESPWTAIKEATGNAAGSMGPMLGARALGMGITAAAPLTGPFAPATALAGQAIANVGPFVAAALPSFGGIREDQIKQDPTAQDSPQDKAVAALGAGTVGLIEGKFGPQSAALKMMTKQGRDALAKKFAETTLAKGIGYGALKGAAVEGAEELVQSPVEQLASYQDPRDPENVKETLFSGAMGAIGGGVLGGGMGAAQQVIGKKPADPPPAPENNGADGWTTSPGASDGTPPTEPPPTGPLGAKFTPEWTTEQGAAPAKQPGIDMPREIDTGALAIKPSEAMGLAPTAGPSLANAAILSVDSGIHQAATEAADPYNAPLSALGMELNKTNQRLRQEADALGLDTEGLHGDAARMTDGKPHEDYLLAANDQLRKAMKAAKEIPYDGQRSGSDDPAPGSEAKGPDAQAGKAPAWDAGWTVRAGAVRPSVDRVGEHGQRPAGTDGGSLPGAVVNKQANQKLAESDLAQKENLTLEKVAQQVQSKTQQGSARLQSPAFPESSDQAQNNTQVLPGTGQSLPGTHATEPGTEHMGPAAGFGTKNQGSAPSGNGTPSEPTKQQGPTTSAPATPTAGLPAAGSATVQAAGVKSQIDSDSSIARLRNDAKNVMLGALSDADKAKEKSAIDAGIVGAIKAGVPEESVYNALFANGKTSANLEKLTTKGTTANVPQPAQPGTQASQAPSAQGAPKVGKEVVPAVPAGNAGNAGNAGKTPSAQGAAPAGTAVAPTIDEAAHQAATSPANALPQPTDGQKKAGNYAKGHVNLNGLDLSIENPAGSERSGKDKDGKAWKNTLKHHYGYIKGTVGNDKDHVDLFVKPGTPLDYSGTVFVVDQHHPHNGRFDEHKVMVGFDNEAQAKKAYHANYAKGWKGMKAITPMTFDAFKAWVKDGAKNTPVSKDKSVSTQPQGATSEPQAQETFTPATGREAQATAAEPVAPELVKVRTLQGVNTYVRKSDLEGDAKLIRMFTSTGKSNGRIHRENLDPTGEKQAAQNAEHADNPFFNVITNKSGGTFATKPVAIREISVRGIGATHQAVPADEIQPGLKGFLIRKKEAQAQQTEAQRPQEQPAASGPVAGAPLPNATEPAPVTANPKIKAETDEKTDLDAQLAALNDELDRQGAVQNANTRAERDAIRKQIAERDFPEILEAVDGDIGTAEDLNRAFQYAGDEPKAKTIERILKKRGITPEYQKRWGDRLMEGQQAGTKPESVVKVPEAIGTAIQEQMEKQKRRVMRRRSEESAPGLNLEQKAAAQTKTKAAEATLRAMRTSIFDAEDAAVKAVETGKASEFEKHADLFPAANDAIRAMLGQNDELDAEMQANEAGLTAQTRADDVKKLVDAAKKQEKEPAPGTRINGLAEPTAEQIAAIGDITIEVPTETGTAKMTVNAAKALASIDERLEALEMVQRCLA